MTCLYDDAGDHSPKIGEGIDDNLANQIISVLLYLESEDATSPVGMYCNIGYSKMKSSLALYDTMRTMPYDIQTVNMGLSAQMGAFIVAGGTKGKRYSLPNSRFAMMNPALDPPYDNEGKPNMVEKDVLATLFMPTTGDARDLPDSHWRTDAKETYTSQYSRMWNGQAFSRLTDQQRTWIWSACSASPRFPPVQWSWGHDGGVGCHVPDPSSGGGRSPWISSGADQC